MSPSTMRSADIVISALCLALPARTMPFSPAMSEVHSRGPSLTDWPAQPFLSRMGGTSLFLATDVQDDETERRLLDELADLTKSFESVQRTVETNAELYKDTIETFQSKVEGLEKVLAESQKSIEEKEEMIQELENSKNDLARQLQNTQEEGNKIAEFYQSKIDGLEKKVRELQELIAEEEETIKELESSKNDLARQLENEQEEGGKGAKIIQEEAGIISVLEEERNNLQSELTVKDKEVSELLKERDDLAGKIRLLQNEAKMYIDSRAETLKEFELRQQAEVSAEVAQAEMHRMQDRLEEYESERNSLRKILGLAWRRLTSVFKRKREG